MSRKDLVSDISKGLKQLNPEYPVAFDTETTGLHHYEHNIFGFSLVQLEPKPVKIWIRTDSIEKEKWYLPLKLFLADPKFKKIWFNGKFDWKMIINEGIEVVNNYEDVQIMSHLVNENMPSFKLFKLCEQYLGKDHEQVVKSNQYETEMKEWLKKNKIDNYALIDPKLMEKYAVGDGVLTCLLYNKLKKNYWLPDYDEIFNIENKMQKVLTFMEYDGVDIDLDHLKMLNEIFLKKRFEILHKINKLNCCGTNDIDEIAKIFNSPKKFGALVYDDLGFKGEDGKPIYTKGGNYSTNEAAIKELIKCNKDNSKVEILELKSNYEHTETSIDFFVEPYIDIALRTGGKVYPSYNQCVAVTGRLTCWKPNIQQLPKRDEKNGHLIRQIFKNPDPNNLDLGDTDYSQVELRLLAHYTKDEDMIQGFKDGFDYHSWTANEIGISRRDAKDANFAIWYGIGNAGLARKFGWTIGEAKKFRTNYFLKFSKIKLLMKQVENTISKRGYVKTFHGRRRRLKPEKSYIGTNAIIQGSAGEVLKLAMINVMEEFKGVVKLKASIHDEILYLKPKGELDKQIKELMEDYDTYRVPLTVDMKNFKENWGVNNGVEVKFN